MLGSYVLVNSKSQGDFFKNKFGLGFQYLTFVKPLFAICGARAVLRNFANFYAINLNSTFLFLELNFHLFRLTKNEKRFIKMKFRNFVLDRFLHRLLDIEILKKESTIRFCIAQMLLKFY